MESAVALWRRMQQEGAAPSTDSCNALLTACLECQHNERALTLFQEMHTLGKPGGGFLSKQGCTAALLCRCLARSRLTFASIRGIAEMTEIMGTFQGISDPGDCMVI